MTEVKTIPYEDIFAPKKVIDDPVEKLDIEKSKPMHEASAEDIRAFFEKMYEEETAALEPSASDVTESTEEIGGPIADITGFHGEEEMEKEKESEDEKPFSFLDMSDEKLEEELRKANKNTYWEFGLYTEKKRRAGKVESFIYEKDGDRLPVLPTYTDKRAREVCGEPVAVSFGDLPPSRNINSKGNPNSIRFSTHLEIHFDITEGAETKEGKSAAYMKAQSFLAAAYRGETLGGKPVRRFRLTNMSEEELKAWGEVRAAFEGQGKKIEFILTDEQQKVFDRYAAEFDEIIKLNRELVGAKDLDLSKPKSLTDLKGLSKETEKFYTRGEGIESLEKETAPEEPVVEGPVTEETLEETPVDELLDLSKPKSLTDLKDLPKETEKFYARGEGIESLEKETAPEEPVVDELEAGPAMPAAAPMSEEETAAQIDAWAKAIEGGEEKSEPSSETTALAEREPHEVVGADLADWEEAATNEEESNAAANDAIPVGPITTENKEFVNLPDVSAFFKNMDEVEATAAKEAREKAIREFFENMDKVEANVAVENAINAFFNNMDKVEATAAKENAIRAFFKVMDEIAKASNNSGVSSVVKEKAPKEEILYDLSTSQGRVDARDAVISRIRTNLKTAYTTRAKGKWAIVEEEAREDLAKYADWHCEKTEEVVAKAEGLRTASDILEEVKRKVGESRFANKRAMDAYNRERNRKGIEQCLRSWEQCKEHEGR